MWLILVLEDSLVIALTPCGWNFVLELCVIDPGVGRQLRDCFTCVDLCLILVLEDSI